MLDPNFRREAEPFFHKNIQNLTEFGPLDGKGRFQMSDFTFHIFTNSKGFGLWTRALGLHTMTGQRLQVDYFNIKFQPKDFSSRHSLVEKSDASPLDLGIV